LDNLAKVSGQKMITKSVLNKNFGYVQEFVSKLPGDNKDVVEKVFVRMGFSLEIKKESTIVDKKTEQNLEKKTGDYQIFYSTLRNDKKIAVEDFVGHMRSRYQQLQRILMQRPELQNLIGIGKIGNERKSQSIIGIVTEKRITKNKNLIIKFEDLTGSINCLVRADKEEIYKKADELLLDDVVGVRASGDREMLFVHDIIFPDSMIYEKVKFNRDISMAFLSDIHVGNMKHLEKSFENFLNWINSDDEQAKKIKYIFITGDNVDGVGIFPAQEFVLKLKSMKEQYSKLADYLSRIPKEITIFMCPGQHDAVRVAEPQPIIGRKYAEPLYNIENLVLVSNPTMVKLIEGNKEFKVLMYHGDSLPPIIKEIKELRDVKAQFTPAKAVRHLLKRRHLFPSHGEAIYIPNVERDHLVISEIPDLVCTGEMHHVDVENYNGSLIISGSCWQGQTPFEEKIGAVPDPCKVPLFNLKTRELKILDFGDEQELKELHVKM
jgi:DNA polymerase II small subunit